MMRTTIPGGGEQFTLMQRISVAESGDEIDLEKENLLIRKNTSYVISKPLTIKNGDVKNARFFVKSSGVVLKDVDRIKTVVLDKTVEEGNFTVQNCNSIQNVFVNGGGEAIYFDSTKIQRLVIKKTDAHIIFNGSSAVIKAFIFNDCKLESKNDDGTTMEDIMISDSVKNLSLAGKLKIGRIVSVKGTVITIVVDVNVTIGSADSTVQDSIKNNSENSGYNSKGEETEDSELTEDEEKEIEQAEKEIEADEVTEIGFYIWKQNGKLEKSQTTRPDVYETEYVKSIDEISIERTETEVILTNKNPQEFDVWKYFAQPAIYPEVKAGKNYKISFDLKADKDSWVKLQAKDEKTFANGSSADCKVTTEYQTFSVTTGTAKFDWTESVIFIAFGTSSKLYIKNYEIEEISEIEKYGKSIYIGEEGHSMDDISVDFEDDTINISFKKLCGEYAGVDILLYDNPVPAGKMTKLSFDITCDADLDGDSNSEGSKFRLWAHVYNNDKDSSGASSHSLSKDVKQEIVLYLIGTQASDEKYRIPYVWFNAGKVCNLKIENIKTEETTIEEIIKENPDLALRFAGTLDDTWYVEPIDFTFPIPPGDNIRGQVILSDSNAWSSKENFVSSFRVVSEDILPSIKIEKKIEYLYGEDDTYFVNTTDETLFVKFSLDDKLRMCVTQGSADDCEGKFGDTVYFRTKPKVEGEDCFYVDCDSRNVTMDETGKWYQTTYNIEYCKVRDKTVESRFAMIRKSAYFVDENSESGWNYKAFATSNIQETDEPQVIKQIFYLPEQEAENLENFWFFLKFQGYNEILKISDYSTELLSEDGSWYYYDIDKSKLTESSFCIIFNNGFGTQTVDIGPLSVENSVYCYDFFETQPDESGRFSCSQSTRSDNPAESPEDGFIRIYFYSKLNGIDPLYLHYYDESASATAFTTVWPGEKMVKY